MISILIALVLAGPMAQGPRQLTVPEQVLPPLIVPEGTTIPVTLITEISTRHAKDGDGVYARTIFPITVDNQIVIPVDTYVRGRIVDVERPGRVSGTAALTLNFHTLVLPSGRTLEIYGSLGGIGGTAERRGEATIAGDTSKSADAGTIATSAGTGTIIGAVGGRGRGAIIGAGAGAAAGVAQVLLTRGEDLTLRPGTTIEIVLDRSLEP